MRIIRWGGQESVIATIIAGTNGMIVKCAVEGCKCGLFFDKLPNGHGAGKISRQIKSHLYRMHGAMADERIINLRCVDRAVSKEEFREPRPKRIRSKAADGALENTAHRTGG